MLSKQEKRYRSMQEHIRRAHPDYYIPKLPATEESFQLMINTPPSQKPPPAPPGTVNRRCMYRRRIQGRDTKTKTADASEHDVYGADISGSETPAHAEGQPPSTANAAVALAQLHANNPTLGWEADFVRFPSLSVSRAGYPPCKFSRLTLHRISTLIQKSSATHYHIQV
jgi:hypothetical protein